METVRQLNFSTVVSQETAFSSGFDKSDKLSWSGIPVISDEVFTGVYRLGCFSSSQLLKFEPDISVHAKLLTGGLLPLSVTLASQSIFDAFLGNEKSAALLHGHSYTAHPVGCEVALKSLEMFKDMHDKGHWKQFKSSWMKELNLSDDIEGYHDHHPFWSTWSNEFVVRVSHNEKVEGAIALGSVFAFSLRDAQGGGMYQLFFLFQTLPIVDEKKIKSYQRVLTSSCRLLFECRSSVTAKPFQVQKWVGQLECAFEGSW